MTLPFFCEEITIAIHTPLNSTVEIEITCQY